MDLKLLVINLFEKVLEKLKDNTCELDKELAVQLLSLISHEPLSKVEACQELGISRSKFDTLIRNGLLPPGRKRIGFNELSWYKDEIIYKYNELNKDE